MMKICLYDGYYNFIWAYSMGNQKISYQLIAITIGFILFAGSISGSASIAFADEDDSKDDFKKLKKLAKEAKNPKKPKDPCKCKGVSELVLSSTTGADVDSVTDKKGDPIDFTDVSDVITITPSSGKLSSSTTITLVGGEVVTIHTSCSKPIDAGDVHGSLTILSVTKIPSTVNEPICYMPMVIDKKKPKVAIDSPEKKETVSGVSLMVIVTATDNVEIAKVEVKLRGGAFAEMAFTGGDSYEFTFPGTVPDGKNKITVKATDTSGNDKRKSIKITVFTP